MKILGPHELPVHLAVHCHGPPECQYSFQTFLSILTFQYSFLSSQYSFLSLQYS